MWTVADRRTFGVVPGRAALRAARTRFQHVAGIVRAVEDRLEAADGDRQRVETRLHDRIERARREGGTTQVGESVRSA